MKMLIGGKHVDASDMRTIPIVNPATHEIIDTVPAAGREDCEQAFCNAQKGFAEWSATPMWKRIEILTACVNNIKAHTNELCELLVKDLGLPAKQAPAEIGTATDRATASIEGARYINGECFVPDNCSFTEGNLMLTTREPLGIVLAIIPFNFPVGTFCTKIFPALLMGNAVIVKLPSDDPLSIIRTAELMLECGVPGNALQIMTGRGSELGEYLVKDSRVDAISMTGSTEVGASVAAAAGKNIAYCALELGGNDALIILQDADLDTAVSEAIRNRCNRSGQICNSSKRILVHNSLKKAFLDKLVASLKNMKMGDPSDMKTDFGPVVSEAAAKEIEAQIQHTAEQGAKILLGGRRINKTFIEPTVMDCPKSADAAGSLEIFGPTWTVIGYDTLEESVAIANNSIYGLSSGVIGNDIHALMYVAKHIQAGTCVINGGGLYTAPYSPFGGYKKSGLGRQSSMDSLTEFSQKKTIVFRKLY